MGATVPVGYGSSTGPLFTRRLFGCYFRVRARLDQWRSFLVLFMAPSPPHSIFWRPFCLVVVGCLVVEFLSFRVSHLGNQAPLKLALVRRSLPSKFIWCLALAVNALRPLESTTMPLVQSSSPSFWIRYRSRCTTSILGPKALLVLLLFLRLPCQLYICCYFFCFSKPLMLYCSVHVPLICMFSVV
ncbi:hypothetical protein GQ457_05G012610 [Hibiscus cannabinus]